MVQFPDPAKKEAPDPQSSKQIKGLHFNLLEKQICKISYSSVRGVSIVQVSLLLLVSMVWGISSGIGPLLPIGLRIVQIL